MNNGRKNRVDKYRYLGSMLSEDWMNATEFNTIIAMAMEAFNKKHLLCINMDFVKKKKWVMWYVWNVPLQSSEMWTLRNI